jgi:RHS repeat-associated protein
VNPLAYNSSKQLKSLSSSGVNISYNYPSSNNNGKIASQTDAISGETVTYTYDTLNRLTAAANQTGFSPLWGQSFTYDGFGNLTNVGVTQGSAPTFSQTYDASNHAGTIDSNGNPASIYLPEAGSSYAATYDVENRITSTGSGTIFYSYAPGNRRVWKGFGTWTTATGECNTGLWTTGSPSYNSNEEITFWGVNGQKLMTYRLEENPSGYYGNCSFTADTPTVDYYFGGKLIKNSLYVTSSDSYSPTWAYQDRLGTIGKSYPYGIERPSASNNNTEKFTGYYRDQETGNDYAINRYMSPGFGRFFTPDPSQGAYANPANPGSWNLYAYAKGDPVGVHDPLGLDDDDCYYGSEFDCGNDNDGGTDLDPFDGTGCNGTACGDVTNPTTNQPSPTNQPSTQPVTINIGGQPGVAGTEGTTNDPPPDNQPPVDPDSPPGPTDPFAPGNNSCAPGNTCPSAPPCSPGNPCIYTPLAPPVFSCIVSPGFVLETWSRYPRAVPQVPPSDNGAIGSGIRVSKPGVQERKLPEQITNIETGQATRSILLSVAADWVNNTIRCFTMRRESHW